MMGWGSGLGFVGSVGGVGFVGLLGLEFSGLLEEPGVSELLFWPPGVATSTFISCSVCAEPLSATTVIVFSPVFKIMLASKVPSSFTVILLLFMIIFTSSLSVLPLTIVEL